MLQGLRLHRPNNSKPNGRRNKSTHILIQEQMGRARRCQFQPTSNAAKYRRRVGEWQWRPRQPERPFSHYQERLSLNSARAISDVIAEKRVAKAVQFRRFLWGIVGPVNERESPMRQLAYTGFQERR